MSDQVRISPDLSEILSLQSGYLRSSNITISRLAEDGKGKEKKLQDSKLRVKEIVAWDNGGQTV